ncbi:MAG: ATP-dependent zinc metalloprotease FtsH [Armatimonadota bacterium]
MNKVTRNVLWVAALVLIAFIVVNRGSGLLPGSNPPQTIDYSEFLRRIEAGELASVKVERHRATGEMRSGGTGTVPFAVELPDSQTEVSRLMAKLETQKERQPELQFKTPNPLFSDTLQNILVSVLIPLGAIVVLWILFWRQAQSSGNQALNFGRSRAKRLTDNVPKVTFEDVAGVEEAKVELQEVVEFLKNPKKFQALGAKIPKGVLLLGPPGCGKTLLARAVAGEAGVPFFHISGSDFVEMFVGVGASRVRDLFDTAKANKPSLVFIDEIDAVGRQRGAGLGGGHDEREQTLNQLLVEMDGFDPNSGVILIAATNRPDVLDPALLRPGRFDRRVVVDQPDVSGRRRILDVHSKGKPLAEEVDLDTLARRTPGFTGADLSNLVNEAALKAARENKQQVFMEDFDAAIDRVVAGPERRSRVLSEKVKKVTAYHEVGHALVQELLPHQSEVHKVTILPRGMALGITWSLPPEDRMYQASKSDLQYEITTLLGGRVAEQMVFNEIHTGASNDLERATSIARDMVTEYGMSERLGPLKLGHRQSNPFLGRDLMEDRNYSEDVAKAIDEEVRSLIETGYQHAWKILEENRELMDKISAVLLERETIGREEFLALIRGEELPAPKTPTPTTPSAPAAPADEGDRRQPQAPPFRPRPEPA